MRDELGELLYRIDTLSSNRPKKEYSVEDMEDQIQVSFHRNFHQFSSSLFVDFLSFLSLIWIIYESRDLL